MTIKLETKLKLEIIKRASELVHKQGVNPADWEKVKEPLLLVIDWLISRCDQTGLPIRITSIIRPKIPGVSTSTTHEDGRAFDLGLIGWSDSDARDCAHRANKELSELGAISAKSGRQTVAVFEDGITKGTGRHLHFQVKK
jgi:hypothetical protein